MKSGHLLDYFDRGWAKTAFTHPARTGARWQENL
jgi:hypothetical protein